MPSADKRQRKKENARIAREAREAAAKRRRRLKTARNVGIVVAIFAIVVTLLNVLGGSSKKATSTTSTTASTPTTVAAAYPAGCTAKAPKKGTPQTYKSAPAMLIDTSKTYVAHVTTNCGSFDMTLDTADAPKTVNSFVFLANNHFYDGLTWHRLVNDFVIQGGDPKGDGTGDPGYKLADEPPKTGYKQWSVAMANSGANTTGSQFFVVVSDNGAKQLGGPPYKYSALGTVTKGTDVVQKMMKLSPAQDGPPLKPLYIDSITITQS